MIHALRRESRKIQDYDFTEAFPDAQIPRFPLGRKARAKDMLPPLFQGDNAYCVPCSVFWISRWFSRDSKSSLEAIVCDNDVNRDGSRLSHVLDYAYKDGLIPNYLYIRNPSDPVQLEKALGISPIIVGLWDWPLVPHQGHAMVLVDQTENGDWLCINWANKERTDFVTLPQDTKFITAVAFANLPKQTKPYSPFIVWILNKLGIYAS